MKKSIYKLPDWYIAIVNANGIKFCHNCKHFTGNHCNHYDMQPPQEFADSVGMCQDWEDDPGFPMMLDN